MSKLRGGTRYKDSGEVYKSPLMKDQMPLQLSVRSRLEWQNGKWVAKEAGRHPAQDRWEREVDDEYRKKYGKVNPSERGQQIRTHYFKRLEKALGGKDNLVRFKINKYMRPSKGTKQTVLFRESPGKFTPGVIQARKAYKKKRLRTLKKPGGTPEMIRANFRHVFVPNMNRPQIPGEGMKTQIPTQPRQLHPTAKQAYGWKAITAGGGKGPVYRNIRQRLKNLLR